MITTLRMPEAEVSIRLAFWLLDSQVSTGVIEVAIDGAQVRVGDAVHFDIDVFMGRCGWRKREQSRAWQCLWFHPRAASMIRIHSNSGRGDVVARLRSGQTLRVECKKGPLERSKSSAEYPLLREALGQLLTIAEVNDDDLLAVAVPHSEKFHELAARWRRAPLIERLGIIILTVDQRGTVLGFPAAG